MNVSDFNHADLAIFEYHDGQKVVKADPWEILSKMQKVLGGKAQQIISDYLSSDWMKSIPVHEQVKQAVHIAFGFEPFDPATGTGTVFKVWDGALEAYLDFFRSLAPSTEPSPTPAQPTEQPLTSQVA